MNRDSEENGWRLEEDTEVKEMILRDDGFARILSLPPEDIKPKRVLRFGAVIKTLFIVSVMAVCFVLGVLFSQNTQLKDESSKLAEESAGLYKTAEIFGTAVDQCRDELKLCVEDVDLMRELNDYEITPKAKYGDGYAAIRTLEAHRAEITEKRGTVQLEIEEAVQRIWRPAKKSRQFWKDLKKKLSLKRKLDRKLKRTEKNLRQEATALDQAFYEKKIKIVDVIREKNETRRRIAAELAALDTIDAVPQKTKDNTPEHPPSTGGSSADSSPSPQKQDLASVVP
jgi:hypothetical protein